MTLEPAGKDGSGRSLSTGGESRAKLDECMACGARDAESCVVFSLSSGRRRGEEARERLGSGVGGSKLTKNVSVRVGLLVRGEVG